MKPNPGHPLELLAGRYAVCLLAPGAPSPAPPSSGELFAAIRAAEGWTVVAREGAVPDGLRTQAGWRALRIQGQLDFELVGVLESLLRPLAAAGVSVFALSTFDTDYVLVQQPQLERALTALQAAGHTVEFASGAIISNGRSPDGR